MKFHAFYRYWFGSLTRKGRGIRHPHRSVGRWKGLMSRYGWNMRKREFDDGRFESGFEPLFDWQRLEYGHAGG